MKKLLKNLLLWNRLSDFEIISQEFSLVTLFKNCLRNFDPSINMALVNGGFLHYTYMKKLLKNLLLRNCWSDFEIISQECFLRNLFKNCLWNFESSINMALVNGGFLHYIDMKKFLKKIFSETTDQILKWFHRNVPWVTLCKNCPRNFDLSINMVLVNGGYLHCMDIKKFM